MGRSLTNAVFNLGLEGEYAEAVKVRREREREKARALRPQGPARPRLPPIFPTPALLTRPSLPRSLSLSPSPAFY